MPAKDLPRIDINTARVGELTQLPGIAKNTAYNIVNHRQRHGLFTAWEELMAVKDFPAEKMSEIKMRASLSLPEGAGSAGRAVKAAHLDRLRKQPAGYTKAARSGRRPGKMHDSSIHRPH
jgi:hypothetical protein